MWQALRYSGLRQTQQPQQLQPSAACSAARSACNSARARTPVRAAPPHLGAVCLEVVKHRDRHRGREVLGAEAVAAAHHAAHHAAGCGERESSAAHTSGRRCRGRRFRARRAAGARARALRDPSLLCRALGCGCTQQCDAMRSATRRHSHTASCATLATTSRYSGSPRLPCSLVRSSTAILVAVAGRPARKCAADQGRYRRTWGATQGGGARAARGRVRGVARLCASGGAAPSTATYTHARAREHNKPALLLRAAARRRPRCRCRAGSP